VAIEISDLDDGWMTMIRLLIAIRFVNSCCVWLLELSEFGGLSRLENWGHKTLYSSVLA
jgi:hypothetical protein